MEMKVILMNPSKILEMIELVVCRAVCELPINSPERRAMDALADEFRKEAIERKRRENSTEK